MLRILKFSPSSRYYSMKHSIKDPTKYTSTINLPKTKFPNRLSAAKREELERNLVETTFAKAYSYQENFKNGPTFVLHDGPPYANGNLHMGHAVNKILKDLTLRQRVGNGQKVNFIPGWDCHGLPIELKALSETSNKYNTKDPIKVRNACRKFALDAVEKQKEEFRSWGVLADWNNDTNTYLTLNPTFIKNQLELFLNFYERGFVYRDLKPVYWSPSSRTALAEAELEYDSNFVSPSVYVRFKLDKISKGIVNISNKNVYALIWTTTPWTLPSNQAICYNLNLEYSIVKLNTTKDSENDVYIMATSLLKDFEATTNIFCDVIATIKGSELKNCSYKPLISKNQKSLSFFDASHVQDTKGTGLVHTAPAHGHEDFLLSLSEKLPVISYVNEEGLYTDDAPNFLKGKEVLTDGNKLVLNYISDDIVFSGDFTHSYPIDWRTKKPVILRASEQWFIDTEKLKQQAIMEIEKVQIYPRGSSVASKNALKAQVSKRPYWCISRQRVWGVPIPVFYNRQTKNVVTNKKIITHLCELILKEGNIDFWWSKPVSEILSIELLNEMNLSADMLEKSTDIFDIWFDSGSSWSEVLKKSKVADLYLEGGDQFTGWFQSSLLTSIAAQNCAPYRSLFVHGFTVDKNGLKMSKSLGNVISPKDITKKFGVDALRWWVASHGTQNMSITVSESLLQQSADSINKIRSTLRYLKGAIGENISNASISKKQIYLNKYLLNSLWKFEQEVQQCYDSYEFNRVVAIIQNFITNQISAIYLHTLKDRLYCGYSDDIQNIRLTLSNCYEVLCKVLWPITPFLVEESWSYFDKSRSFHEINLQNYKTWRNDHAERVIERALDVKRLLNQTIQDKNTWTLDVSIAIRNHEDLNLLLTLQPQENVAIVDSELSEILQVGKIELTRADQILNEDFYVTIKEMKTSLCPRCRRFAITDNESICCRCTQVLDREKTTKIEYSIH